MQCMLAHNGLLPSRFLVKIPHCVMIITPFDFCCAASTLYGDIEGADLDISRPKSVSIRASCLENARTGRQWTRPMPEKFLGARNAQHIRGLCDQKKKVGVTLSTMTCSGN
jgi:hypothetical protein